MTIHPASRDTTVIRDERGSGWTAVRSHSFGPASELPYRRRVSDWIRLAVGTGLVLGLLGHQDNESPFELDIFRTIHDLPRSAESAVRLLYALGALWAVGLVVVAAIVARRRRLVRDLLLGGAITWALSRLIADLVGGSSFARSLDVFVSVHHDAPEYPAVRVAVLVGVISVASPYLTRPVRRFGQTLVLLMFFAAMYLGASQFDDVIAALAVGWTVAAGVHLLFGSPGGRPTTRQVQAALAELGVDVESLMLASEQPGGGTRMVGSDERGAIELRVLGRDEADAQILAKFWRSVFFRDGGGIVHLTRLEDVADEAYALLLAARADVRVPEVLVAGTAGAGTALVVTRPPERVVSLAAADPGSVDDEILGDLWRQVAALHRAHVTHGRLNAHHVYLGRAGVAIVDFEHASGTTASRSRQATDVAELLASTAAIVGTERAVRAAIAGLGAEQVVAALPVLQPAALSRDIRPSSAHREQRKAFNQQLGDIREAIAAAADTSVPPLQELYRVNGSNLLMAVGLLLGVAALFSQVGSPGELWDTLKGAHAGWLTVALALSLLTNVATAVALDGASPVNLPLLRTSELQLAMSFGNLAVPAVGGMASQVRFLQRQGMELSEALASGGLLANVGGVVAQLMLLAVAIPLTPTHYEMARIDTGKLADLALIAVLVLVGGIGIVIGIPKLRRSLAGPAKSAASTIWSCVCSPRRLTLLLAGNMVNALLYAAVYVACIAAFGASVNFWAILALNIVIGTIAGLIPIPGGGAAVSSVGMSGALAAAGVPIEAAVAAALVNQLVVSYIPAIPGWFATKDLLRADYL